VTSELKVRLSEAVSGDGSGRPSLALALVADNLSTGYGLDRYGATVIAERQGLGSWTANAGYRLVERYRARERLEEAKLGIGGQWRLFTLDRTRAGELAVSSGWLIRNEGLPIVWQSGVRLGVALVDGVRLSLAAHRSDRPDLSGPRDGGAQGVMSVTYDLGGR
jgi:hypothetical protein